MEEAKISLSAEELLLMRNSQWILTKNLVLDKVNQGLGALANRMQDEVSRAGESLISEVLLSNAKISKGEKYKGLPYLILDYPRIFDKERILAIRTLFWWGNFCSITLHLKGTYLLRVIKKLSAGNLNTGDKDLYISFSGDEWNHDLSEKDYQRIGAAGFPWQAHQPGYSGFLKLTVRIPLAQWNIMEDDLFDSFRILLTLLEI